MLTIYTVGIKAMNGMRLSGLLKIMMFTGSVVM